MITIKINHKHKKLIITEIRIPECRFRQRLNSKEKFILCQFLINQHELLTGQSYFFCIIFICFQVKKFSMAPTQVR